MSHLIASSKARFAALNVPAPRHLWLPPSTQDYAGEQPLTESGTAMIHSSTVPSAAFTHSMLCDGTDANSLRIPSRRCKNLPAGTAFGSSASASFICWFKCTNAGDNNRVWSLMPAGGGNIYFIFTAWSTGHFFQAYQSVHRSADSTKARDTNWHMAYCEIINSTSIGVSLDTETLVTTALTGAIATDAGTEFRIGEQDDADANGMKGNIALVAYWTQTLTAAHRTSLYNAGSGVGII